MKNFEVLLLIFLCTHIVNSSVSIDKEVVCSKTERQALLSFKKGLKDPTNWLSSWIGDDCCTWKGVSCNNRTGHVVKLNLRQPFQDSLKESDSSPDSLLGGEVSPSLLELKHLMYLDLSVKNFDGICIPEFLGSLKSLRYLNLSNAGFGGMVPHQLGNLSSLHHLDLSTNYFVPIYDYTKLHAESFQWLSHLSSLQYLGMNQVDLSKATDYLQVLNMLPSLTELFLSSCELNPIPDFPAPLVNFTSLTIIDLSYNNLNSFTLDWLFRIKGFVSLTLQSNGFEGPIPDGFQNMTSLRVLDLSYNNFNSTVPDWLYNMSSLVTLYLSDNHLTGSIMTAFEGGIPVTLGNLCKLQTLDLSNNYLSGPLPDQLGQLKSLTDLSLQNNSFPGPIPPSIGLMSSLRSLNLACNQLNGSIPHSLGRLSQLEDLDISYNSLEYEVSEVHFANLTRLKLFDASSNSLILKVSFNWIPPFQLKEIRMGSCQVGPQFPAWLQTQRNLYNLNLSHTGISDEIPTWFWNLSANIQYLDLSSNQIYGELPRTLKLGYFASISLGSNNLKGPLPHFTSDVFLLDLSNNSFSGPISYFLCRTLDEPSNLRILDLSDNLLSGEMPDCWMNWPSLSTIRLGNNRITGNVPSSLGSLARLHFLHLRNNRLSGELPSALQNCTLLLIIDLGKNEFSGSIPMWLGKRLANLIVLGLHSNNFVGSISPKLCDISSLQVLDLSRNNLTGTIPQCFSNFSAMATYNMKAEILSNYAEIEQMPLIIKGIECEYSTTLKLLKSIDLSDNHLSGEIPKELTSLLGLESLNLSRNHLTGNIPEKIGDMIWLESLDLSTNRLSGGIPQSISRLTFLGTLDLSYNTLSGSIPLSTQLQSFNASSFMGNRGLCGPPLTQNCTEDGPKPNNNDQRGEEGSVFQMEVFYLSMALGFVVGFWGVWGPLLFKKSWRIAYFQFLTAIINKYFG